MSDEALIRSMVRSQYRLEGELTAPSNLTTIEREWWNKEATIIEQEERVSL